MAEVEIYTQGWCPYCVRAKRLLDGRGVEYREIDLGAEPERVDEMVRRAGGRQTVPQIFIGGRHVGGAEGREAGGLEVAVVGQRDARRRPAVGSVGEGDRVPRGQRRYGVERAVDVGVEVVAGAVLGEDGAAAPEAWRPGPART